MDVCGYESMYFLCKSEREKACTMGKFSQVKECKARLTTKDKSTVYSFNEMGG